MQPGSYFPFSFLSDHWRPLRPVQKKKKYQNEAAAAEQPSSFFIFFFALRSFGSNGVVLLASSGAFRSPWANGEEEEEVEKRPDCKCFHSQTWCYLSIWRKIFFFCSLYSHFPSLFLPFSFNGSVFTLLLLFNGPLFCCLLFCWPFNSCRNF